MTAATDSLACLVDAIGKCPMAVDPKTGKFFDAVGEGVLMQSRLRAERSVLTSLVELMDTEHNGGVFPLGDDLARAESILITMKEFVFRTDSGISVVLTAVDEALNDLHRNSRAWPERGHTKKKDETQRRRKIIADASALHDLLCDSMERLHQVMPAGMLHNPYPY